MAGLVHVGAWEGLEFIGDQRRLLLFEPYPETFEILKANVAGNPDTEIVNSAVGEKAGTAVLHVFTPSHSSSLLTPLVECFSTPVIDKIAYTGMADVKVTTLDIELADREGFDELRIDTQGFELGVLKGATEALKTLQRVELELHDPSTYEGAATLGEIDDFMWEHGWRNVHNDVQGSDGLGDVTYEPA
jgi:FkbM family methyltransferase